MPHIQSHIVSCQEGPIIFYQLLSLTKDLCIYALVYRDLKRESCKIIIYQKADRLNLSNTGNIKQKHLKDAKLAAVLLLENAKSMAVQNSLPVQKFYLSDWAPFQSTARNYILYFSFTVSKVKEE